MFNLQNDGVCEPLFSIKNVFFLMYFTFRKAPAKYSVVILMEVTCHSDVVGGKSDFKKEEKTNAAPGKAFKTHNHPSLTLKY